MEDIDGKRNLDPLADLPQIHAVRIAGAQAGIEFVDGERAGAENFENALDQRLLVYAGGWHGNVLMLLPPLSIKS